MYACEWQCLIFYICQQVMDARITLVSTKEFLNLIPEFLLGFLRERECCYGYESSTFVDCVSLLIQYICSYASYLEASSSICKCDKLQSEYCENIHLPEGLLWCEYKSLHYDRGLCCSLAFLLMKDIDQK